MALDKYTITVKLDAESSAIMQRVTDNLAQIESLLTETMKLFSARLSDTLKTEVTEINVAELGDAVQREGEKFIRLWRSGSVPPVKQSPVDSSERLV